MTGRLRWLAAACLLAAVPGVPSSGRAGTQAGGWRVDERVLITDFGMVTALASSPEGLHVATTGGLLTLDETFGGWQLPIGVEDGYPALPVTALAYDHRDGTLWMSAGGDLLQLDPFGRRFVDRVPVGRRAEELVPAEGASSDLFLRSMGEWWRFDTFGGDLRRADPAAVRAAIDARPDLRARREALDDPFFRDGVERLARDWMGRSLRITDVTQARDAYRWWVGTAGGLLFSYDHVSRSGERHVYGPTGRGMAAVAVAGDETWFAPASPLEGRYGIAAAGPDLQEWRVWRVDSSRTGPDLVRTVLARMGGVWAGGESGLHWLGGDAREWLEAPGVDAPMRPVLALAPASGGEPEAVWAGTVRGVLRFVGATASPDVNLLPAESVTSVLEASGFVWIGTTRGLFACPLGVDGGDMSRKVGRVDGPAALGGTVGGIVALADTLLVGLDAEVWWRTGGEGRWSRVDAVGRQRAPVTALSLAEGTLWVGSRDGLTVWDVRGGNVRNFRFGIDLPPDARGATGIHAIAPTSRTEAWLATPAGALRIETGL